MAKANQTHQKRQRENKVREKARLKREQRQERRDENKLSLEGQGIDESSVSLEGDGGTDLPVEPDDLNQALEKATD